MTNYGYLQSNVTSGPQCLIHIYNPTDVRFGLNISAVIDSGAVITCISEEWVQKLGNLVRMPSMEIKTSTNAVYSVESYIVSLQFPEFDEDIQNLRVISIPRKKYAVIGRDILNRYKIVMDGPSSTFRLSCAMLCNHTEQHP
jgi:hypothetical protein